MNFYHKYVEYLKDNPEGYWFKRKLYGWGWTPARKEGWLVIAVYLFAVIVLATRVNENAALSELAWSFFIPLGAMTFFLILVCYLKGEKPRWQWGEAIKDD
jgi:hypothetical protein